MQRRELPRRLIVIAAAVALTTATAGYGQSLWKYTDKDGKITYSDKAPKKGENAQLVANDPAANVIEASKNTRQGVPQKLQDVKARATERENQRERLRAALETAKTDFNAAKTALDEGREPLANEVQIVVGRTKTGATTGVNSQLRKPEYYARITTLEEAVTKAEAKVELAEQNFRREAP